MRHLVEESSSCSHQAHAAAPAMGTEASQQATAPDVRVRGAVANVTVGNADALECGVCFLALRPPIFQCEVGHVVCSACRDKLEATGNRRCHVCGVVAARGGGNRRYYRRCHAMEQLVDCIRVPCPYAAHGCDATPPYHGQERHRRVCLHAPCHCPGESCGFVGSTSALLDHFAAAHDWPCTTVVRGVARPWEFFSISLYDGFNFLSVADDHDGCGRGAAATCSRVVLCLFLVNVARERIARAISVLRIHPRVSGVDVDQPPLPTTQCELVFSRSGDGRSLCRSHYQSSEFEVACSDLSTGLPSTDACFQFVVPNSLAADKNCIQVKIRFQLKY